MKAYELLAPEGAWCQGAAAKDRDGEVVGYTSPNAVAFCLVGAMYKCNDSIPDQDRLLLKIKRRIGHRCGDWNDAPERTQAEVVALLKELDI